MKTDRCAALLQGKSKKGKGKIPRFFVSIIAFDVLDWALSTVN